jgi:DNA-directed RNA polymerase specialized sigma24 family protein
VIEQNTSALYARATTRRPGKPREWKLTTEAFDKLLTLIDADRERAADKYVNLYSKLTKFFEWRGCTLPDMYADETINRVTRKIEQGAVITNLHGFLYGVAKNVVVEALRAQDKEQKKLVELAHIKRAQPTTHEPDCRLACIEACLQKLPADGRELLLAYYRTDNSKLEHRQALARRQGISLNALRVRVCRLRVLLERHVTACLPDYADRGTNLPARCRANTKRLSFRL